MRKFLVLTGSLLLVAALGWGGWLAWPILFPALPSAWLSTLAKADAALVQNRPDLARKVLEKVHGPLPVAGWLQWEKRVQAVAVQTQAWKWAAATASRAQAQYPGNPDLAAYLVWTLLQDHRPAEAALVAQKVLPGTPWEGLALQAKIEAAGLASGDWSDLKETLAQPSEASFAAYQRLVTLSPEPGLRKNALLTALAQGRLDEARTHLDVLTPEQRDKPPFDRLQGLMAYDQGDWARAAALLKSLSQGRVETLLVLADVYLHLGEPSQARIIYDQLLADHPEAPSSLLVNRASLALEEDNPSLALALLGRVDDPGLVQARLLVLETRFRLGEVEEVRRALDRLMAEGESDLSLEAELLKGRLFPDWTSAPRLWSLLHRHPAYGPLAERLAWLLQSQLDYAGAHRVLDLHEAALTKAGQESPWWSRFLRALVLGAENRLDEALRTLDTVPAAWRDPSFFADLSLVASVRSQQVAPQDRKPLLDTALEQVSRALELLPPGTNPASLQRRSLWLTRRGEVRTALVPLEVPARRGTLRSEATEDLRQAVQLDPDNLRASFLLRQDLVATQEKP